jgi:hypothetical protein
VAKARIAEAMTALKYILTFEKVDNLCWYQRNRCRKVCKLREVVSLAAFGISIVLVIIVDCAGVCADDFLFFQVGAVVYIDKTSSHRSSFSRSNGSNMSKSGQHTYASR